VPRVRASDHPLPPADGVQLRLIGVSAEAAVPAFGVCAVTTYPSSAVTTLPAGSLQVTVENPASVRICRADDAFSPTTFGTVIVTVDGVGLTLGLELELAVGVALAPPGAVLLDAVLLDAVLLAPVGDAEDTVLDVGVADTGPPDWSSLPQ